MMPFSLVLQDASDQVRILDFKYACGLPEHEIIVIVF